MVTNRATVYTFEKGTAWYAHDMESKKVIWLGMGVGSTIGSVIPLLWGGSELSMSSIFLSAFGGAVGIWLAFKLTR